MSASPLTTAELLSAWIDWVDLSAWLDAANDLGLVGWEETPDSTVCAVLDPALCVDVVLAMGYMGAWALTGSEDLSPVLEAPWVAAGVRGNVIYLAGQNPVPGAVSANVLGIPVAKEWIAQIREQSTLGVGLPADLRTLTPSRALPLHSWPDGASVHSWAQGAVSGSRDALPLLKKVG